jgi:DNA-directed RNA polymerase specialized sigma24 family protein
MPGHGAYAGKSAAATQGRRPASRLGTTLRDVLGGVLGYARKLGLDDVSSQDVLQETMVALMRVLPGFQYDPRRGG